MVEQKGAEAKRSTFIISQDHPEAELGRQLCDAGGNLLMLTDRQGKVTILVGPQMLEAYHNMRDELSDIIVTSNRELSTEFLRGAVDQIVKNYTD